jgi:hypothetical protein
LGVLVLALMSCASTRPHAPVAGVHSVAVNWREQERDDGACTYETEDLRFGALDLWVDPEPPPAEPSCREPYERARTVDVLGQDGPYLSVRLGTRDCCPERRTAACVTYDVRSGLPITLRQYDPRRADGRLARAQALVPDGYTLSRDAFAVGGGSVRFCAFRGDEVLLIEVP